MYREIRKDIVCKQTVEITKTAIEEIMDKIDESKSGRSIRIVVAYKDTDDVVLGSDLYIIDGTNYDLLMSAYPNFSPNKPENEYREVDLWYFIDQIRNGL